MGLKSLEQRITDLEKSVNNNNNTHSDPEYIKVINILVIVCVNVNLCKLTYQLINY